MSSAQKKNKIRLGVNIDHVATLRQVRGGTTVYPDIYKMTQEAIRGGAEQITIHLREDRRHIQDADLELLARKCEVPLNLELACDPKMVRIAREHKPDWVCFVPEKRAELTTEGGLNVVKLHKTVAPMIEKLQTVGIEISMFIEPDIKQVQASYDVGADAVEFHTGRWVLLKGPKKQMEWKRLVKAAEFAHKLGLGVHAGHGLDYAHAKQITKMPYLREVNIGHSLVCYALENGFKAAVAQMKSILDQ